MSGITLPGHMYLPLFGFTVTNRSLAGRSNPLFPNRLLELKGKTKPPSQYAFRGDQLTRGTVEFLGLVWGDSTELVYASLQPEWKYEWDLNVRSFTVTTEEGQTIIHNDISTVTGLGVSWEIFTSAQFWIYFDPNNGPIEEIFLIGTRLPINHEAERKLFGHMVIDYLLGVQHAVFDFLSDSNPEHDITYGSTEISPVTLFGIENYPDILLAYTNEINFMNSYPVDLCRGEDPHAGERSIIEHQGYAHTITYLMIRMFAVRLLSPLNSKIVYEPWMLWEMFKWLYVRPNAGARDKIFDLSPWWG